MITVDCDSAVASHSRADASFKQRDRKCYVTFIQWFYNEEIYKE